jgi:hypothetical protein
MDYDFTELNAWLTRFDGYARPELDALVADGRAEYDADRAVWIIQDTGGPYEVRDVDAAPAGPAPGAPGSVPLGAAEIDRALIWFEAGLPPEGPREAFIYQVLAGPDAKGQDSPWRDELLGQLEAAAPREWYLVSYAAGDGTSRPVTAFSEEAALRAARGMSGAGEQVDVVHVAGDGTRQLVGSFRGGRPLGATRRADPRPARPGQAPLVLSAPAVADVVGPPVLAPPGDRRVTPRQFPAGISPLPVDAASGGPAQPTRLVYANGRPVDCRPAGRTGPAWTGVAAGVWPADGTLAPGWLQVVSRDNGSLVVLHPALVSPRGISPYSFLSLRQQNRFGEFDAAEAAGQDAARLPAMSVDAGDRVRTSAGEIREVTRASQVGDSAVRIITRATGGPAGTHSLDVGSKELVEVLIPGRHPARDRPDAARLFAVPVPQTRQHQAAGLLAYSAGRHGGEPGTQPAPQPGRQIGQLARTLASLREHGRHAAGAPQPALPAQPGWQVAVDATGAMQRVQDQAATAITGLTRNAAWRRLRALTTSARRLAADAGAGRLRFADPARALRIWKAVWGRACELTGDLAAAMMTRLRQGSSPWYAARAVHHAAAEGVAHAYAWLPRAERLPAGSYEAPPGYQARTRPRADAATRLHQAGAGRLDQLVDFPGPLAGVPPRQIPGRRDRRRAARTAAARPARPGAARPGPGPAAG